MFRKYLENEQVKKMTPDKQLAKSLIKIAEFRIKDIENRSITNKNAFIFVEESYESIRELIDALMALDGYKSYSHEACVDFLSDFYKEKMTPAKIHRIDLYRRMRNDIKYRGIIISVDEAKQILNESIKIFKSLLKITEDKL